MDRPWISCNLAVSADGKISSVGHRPSTWTSQSDHQRLLELRRPAQALLVGRGTFDTDQMTLTVPNSPTQPLRCIVSRHGDIDAAHPVFQRPGGDIHLLVTGTPKVPANLQATIHQLDLAGFLTLLKTKHGINHLHCEGGGQLIRALADLNALDTIHLTLAGHTMLGGASSPTLTGIPGMDAIASRAYTLESFEPQPESGECFLSYRRNQ